MAGGGYNDEPEKTEAKMKEGKYVIIDLRTMDFMKNEAGEMNFYDTEDEASTICGLYEFENAWVCKLIYNHIEQDINPNTNIPKL